MMMSGVQIMPLLVMLIVTLITVPTTTARRGANKGKKNLQCGACLVVVDEVNLGIKKVGSKRTIDVGSYRLDSKGNQGTVQKPYARSETHLTEVFDKVCGETNNYAESTVDGQTTFVRFQSSDGSAVTISNVNINGETQRELKQACEQVVGDYEDDMIPYFMNDEPEIEREICVHATGLCTDKMVDHRMKALGKAVKHHRSGAPKRRSKRQEQPTEEEDVEEILAEEEEFKKRRDQKRRPKDEF